MLLTGKIKTIVSTGSPDYIICGQSFTNLSLNNLNFKLQISKNGGNVQTLVDTNNLAGASGFVFDTYNYGNYDIKFIAFVINVMTSSFQIKLEVFDKGTTNVVTWEKFNLFLEISKTGYQPFRNTFELYNYDVGNSSSIFGFTDTTGNEDFEIILVDDANNLDIYDRQTKAASNLLVLRRPFTNEVRFYNMIGTQGYISYSTSSGIIGNGDGGVLIEGDDVLIEQTVSLNSSMCTTGKMCLHKVWWPKLVTSYVSSDTCNDCTNNIAETTVSYYLDATLVSVFNIHGTPYFLSEFMTNNIKIEILNYKSEIIEDEEYNEVLTYALWIADSSQFLNPVDLVFIPSEIGDNVIKITSTYKYTKDSDDLDVELYICVTTYLLPTCNWWAVSSGEKCGDYTISNCSSDPITLTLQILNEDKTFTDISESEIDSFEFLTINIVTDGIYMLKIVHVNDEDETITQYYSLPVYCSLQNCFLKYLKETLCTVINTNCIPVSHYNFNGLIINAHTYFLLLNQELNYNFIYETISTDKINELYTLKTFIDRFTEYCNASDSPCVPCNE